ncbi:MAG TPA: hypothetical protein PLI45_01085 [Candidatus Woesebacteria bacterium]|nr:hypothetical protein [Candidatus Woesebacteria bacterium]
MGKIKIILVLSLIAIAVIFGLRLLSPEDSWICVDGSWQKHGQPSTPMPTTECFLSSQSNSTDVTQTPSVSETKTKKYINTQMAFSASLPNSVDAQENLDGTVSFPKWGPTQKTQTELFDGYSVNIDQGSLGANKDLKSLIEADIEQKKEQLSPDFKIIVAPIPYKSTGFYYLSEDSFGEVAYYYIPQTSEKFLLVTSVIKDPGKLGFKEEVGNIIESITMTP